MIVQQINLYQDRFRQKRVILSAIDMLVILAVAVALLLLSSYWYQLQLTDARQQQQSLTSQKQQVTASLDQTRKVLAERLADDSIEIQVNKVSREITIRKRLIDMVANNQFGSGQGFSSNLSELSRFRVNDVWLNEISMSDRDIKISGSALKAENVPEYFDQFQQRALFSGHVFEIFELNRDDKRDWKVDFLISSRADF